VNRANDILGLTVAYRKMLKLVFMLKLYSEFQLSRTYYLRREASPLGLITHYSNKSMWSTQSKTVVNYALYT
jgi:hypothetical protein